MKEEKLSGALQENILTLLSFSDEYCKIIRHGVTPTLFESAVFRDIANHSIDFIDQFGEAIKDHISDSLELVLKGSDKRKAASYTRILDNLYLSKDSVNGDYVVSKLHEFVRQQQLKSALVAAVECIEDGRIAAAEVELQKGLASQSISFELGTMFADPAQSLRFFNQEQDGILTGIKELDKRDIMPQPGEVFLGIASAGKGKSWLLTHLGKMGILQRKQVLHVTLEMSEKRTSQRYIQSFFSISKRQSEVKTAIFRTNEHGMLLDIDFDTVSRPTLQDAKMRESLSKRLVKEFKSKTPLIIKQFPTGSLTIAGLKAYLDGLERFHKITPDMLLLDYPDLMNVDSANLRLDLGQLFKDLRGIAGERNLALCAVTQGNRESSKAKLVTDAMVAEDYSKIATADNVITYSQTPQEHALGLARLFVAKGRNDQDKFTVLISQAYAMGQFCLDSAIMSSDYWDMVEDASPGKAKPKEKDD